jgi:3-hydroxyacyl-CoA dehydrogenase/enoyl-CoA hydratase/3-hydroxybutyryl-CoA epimerase
MCERKWLGKKTGKGFYLYEGKNRSFNPEVLHFLGPAVPATVNSSNVELSDRVFLLMINEAAKCLQEKIITRPDYLDMAMILGGGFPPFRGGLLKYADKLGISYVVDHLKIFEQKKLGNYFSPCDLLLEMYANKTKFYN